ncbi:PTS beta-glucoside transporter subunit IIABC, partial [Erysipelatoclostridium ramosum]|nr:PTS beta-glucoside transporter subunit IIABC [Thomasclavelia ramosa]
KQVKIDPFIGIGIGAALCNPNISGIPLDIFGFEITATYTSTVLPVILIVLLASPIAKFLNRKVPDILRGFGVPFLTFIIVIPLGFCLIGPVVNAFG